MLSQYIYRETYMYILVYMQYCIYMYTCIYTVLCMFSHVHDPMDCSLPVSSVHGIFQARILKWFAMPFSRGNLPDPGSKPASPVLQADFYKKPPLILLAKISWNMIYHSKHLRLIYLIKMFLGFHFQE